MARKKGKMENATVRLQGTKGVTQPLSFSGYRLDDFGAGAGNFQCLSSMEVGVVKLDGSAVRKAQKARRVRPF